MYIKIKLNMPKILDLMLEALGVYYLFISVKTHISV
jgi:hypothetical protein